MSLKLLTTPDERLVCEEVVCALRAALSSAGRAVLLVPSFAQALEAQRALADAGGLSLGVTVTTPAAWVDEHWGVWGDGRRLVDDVSRDVLTSRVLTRAADLHRPGVTDNPGVAGLLGDLARAGLPWLAGAPAPEGATAAEVATVSLLADYAAELSARGLVEPCEAAVALPGLLASAGAKVPPIVLAGFLEMRRAERELVCGLAACGEVTLVAHLGKGPAFAQTRSLTEQLGSLAADRGAEVAHEAGACIPAAQDRASELSALLDALFAGSPEPVELSGSVLLLLSAGHSAQAELVAREVRSLADAGAHEVAVVAPDPAGAWRTLSGKLAARGVSVRAQLIAGVPSLECGRAFLEFASGVARLAELAGTWPPSEPVPDAPKAGTTRVRLADMSWWPPRELSDFLVSDISHTDARRVRDLDAAWRGNRLLTPGAVLAQLQSERDVSPEVAAATRELLRGRLGSAASKLLAPYVQGEKVGSPAAVEATAALSAVLGVAKSLKELGFTADPSVPEHLSLVELVELASVALARSHASLRLERSVPGASCAARIMSVSEAARLAPCSVDAVVMLGQTSTSSPVAAPDNALTALLEMYGVEGQPHAMDLARARFAATVRAARCTLALERSLYETDGKDLYPSVMMTEVLACYGIAADIELKDLTEFFGRRLIQHSETLVCENLGSAGEPARLVESEEVAPAGRIRAEERACVSPPPEGVSAEESAPILSASQIETYLECPYKWFSLRRLRLRDADAGFTGAEMGTFAHRVLEVTRRELLARAVERSLGGTELADARAASSDAMQATAYRELVAELEARAQAVPTVRLPGSSVADPAALEEACAVLAEEFDAHLSHQYQVDRRHHPLPQALVPHAVREEGQLQALRRDLTSLLGYEAGMLAGFEPRFFEWGFGRGGACVEYAGVRLTGTIDRIDVDAHGQAVVIDYKHKSDNHFAAEYDVFSKGGADPSALSLPRRVQSLIYGQVVRRAFPQLKVRAAVYLCTRGSHALAGAVDEEALDAVFGDRPPTNERLARLSVPRAASFGRADEGGMEALLDSCEELIAARLERLLAGDIEAAPLDAAACQFCPVLNCERRLGK